MSGLRIIAVLIAIAGVLDPSWSVARPEPQRLVAIDLMDGDAATAVTAMQAALPDWAVERREGASRGIPCAPGEQCVLIADGSVDAAIAADRQRPLSMIAVRDAGPLNVAVRSALAPSAHATAAGTVRVELMRTGAVAETTIVIRDGAAVVGSLVHKWGEGANAVVDVPWWPLDAGARALRIEAVEATGESTTVDNGIDVGVEVLSTRLRALVFDARPSWNSTFVRRALEDDPRLEVDHRARVAPALTAGTRGGSLDVASLDDSPVVIVGDPDALTAADVALLERYVRVRGGSLILLPERRMAGEATRLISGNWTEHLVPAPERVGLLQASEMLRASNLPVTATVLASSSSAPSVVSMPIGNGRVVLSGAMDAWRFRDASFDSFWRSVVVEAAVAGTSLRVDPAESLMARGQRVPFVVRAQSFSQTLSSEVSVTARCGDDDMPVRVWPSGSPGEFAGEMTAADSSCELRASLDGRVAVTHIAVNAQPARGVDTTIATLERKVRDAGGTVTPVGDEAALARQLSSSFTATSQVVSVRPMRALWWMFPFAGCLAVEWWLRRRKGLR